MQVFIQCLSLHLGTSLLSRDVHESRFKSEIYHEEWGRLRDSKITQSCEWIKSCFTTAYSVYTRICTFFCHLLCCFLLRIQALKDGCTIYTSFFLNCLNVSPCKACKVNYSPLRVVTSLNVQRALYQRRFVVRRHHVRVGGPKKDFLCRRRRDTDRVEVS